MRDVMLDLETFGNESDSVIIGIGAVKFNPEQCVIVDKFYARVDPQSCLDAGLTVTGSTLLWWLQQSEAARKEYVGTLAPIKSALEAFSGWMAKDFHLVKGGPRVWGNGATFDNVILSNAYKALKMERPWGYRDDRCYRTIRALFPNVQHPQFNGTAHRADHDAEHQAMHLMDIWPKIRGL